MKRDNISLIFWLLIFIISTFDVFAATDIDLIQAISFSAPAVILGIYLERFFKKYIDKYNCDED